MSSPIRACSNCGESFSLVGPEGAIQEVCPVCAAPAVPEPHAESNRDDPPRFVSLSELPPDKRMPPRRDHRPGLFEPRRFEEMAGGVVAPPAPSLPAVSSPQPMPPAPPMPSGPQLRFNCPSCFTVLLINEPQQYDGHAAPCPHCGVTILPPRVALADPLPLVSPADAPADAPAPPSLRDLPVEVSPAQ